MNNHQLEELEKKLEIEIKNTQKSINKYTDLCKPIAPENSIGRVSRMDAINNKSIVEAALRVAIEKMQQLQAMQNKIKDSNFGICKKCTQEIPLARLMIQPHSEFCVSCAQ